MSGTFVMADWRYDPDTGLDVTRVCVAGVYGNVADITNGLRACNRYNITVEIRIADVSLLQNITSAHYIRYVAIKILEPPGAADSKVTVQDGAAVDAATNYVILRPGQCAILGVDVVVDAYAPYYKTPVAYRINIEMVPQYDVA